MIPFPLPAAVAFLAEHPDLFLLHDGRVSTALDLTGPCIRISLLPGATGPTWQWTSHVQIDCWAKDELVAGQLVATARWVWQTFRGPVDSNGYVSSAWIASEPLYFWDEDADLHRYMFTGGLNMHERDSA